VLDTMGEVAEETSVTLLRIQSSLDLLHGVIANIDTKQMRTQLELQAAAIEDTASKHGDTTRILAVLMEKLQILERGAAPKSPRVEIAPDPQIGGCSFIQPVAPNWTGNTAGATTSTAPRMGGIAIDPGGDGILGGGRPGGTGGGDLGGTGGGSPGSDFDGAGGGGHGGAGGGRYGVVGHATTQSTPMLKMSFP
jgi:hypothetical protein